MARAPLPPPPAQPQWFQAPDGSWHPVMMPPPPVPAPPPPPPPTTVKAKSSSPLGGLLACVFLGVIAIGVLAVVSTPTKSPATASKDKSALACDRFRIIAGDVKAGILTDPELRQKLAEVDQNAAIATPEVQQAARRMLATITTGTPDDFAKAVIEMDTACKAAGH